MANLSASFLSVEDEETRILCSKYFNKSDVVNLFTQKGLPTLVKNALKWKHIHLPVSDPYYLFTTVHEVIKNVQKAFGQAHEKCRITLSTKSDAYKRRYGEIDPDEQSAVDDEKRPVWWTSSLIAVSSHKNILHWKKMEHMYEKTSSKRKKLTMRLVPQNQINFTTKKVTMRLVPQSNKLNYLLGRVPWKCPMRLLRRATSLIVNFLWKSLVKYFEYQPSRIIWKIYRK